MALVNNSSFVPTANEFLAHWNSVNTEAVPSGFVLPGVTGVIPPGFNRSGLVVLRDLLISQLQDVQDKLNDVEIASGRIAILKEKLYKRMGLFLEVVDGYYAESEYMSTRPEAPGITAGEERFLTPMRDMRSLWTKLNGATAPAGLTVPITLEAGTPELPEPVTVADFSTMLNLLIQRYGEHGEARQNLTLARARRDKTMKNIRAVLVQYRATVLKPLAGNEPLLNTVPRVTPEPGHTPAPVQVSATHVEPDKAALTHTQSDDPDFKSYQIAAAMGVNSTLEDAITLETRTERTPAPFETTFGLAEPGSAISLWVIVSTTDGNERASEKVVVQRPA